MPMTGISSGRDIVVTIIDTNGPVLTSRAKEYSSSQKVNARESSSLDGITRHASFPGGWEGNLMMERTSSAVDDYIARYESLYYSGQTLPTITLQIQIRESTGTITQYQHQGVVFHFDDAGSWKGDDFVTQKLSFKSQNRLKLA